MSNTPTQEAPLQGLSSGSGQTLPSRPLQPVSDPSASKRVCFYKSGDYKFSGHRMVINARTFKTFDALLDALSKKVPLPFGVRTITTPRGTHLVKGLDDLHDGGSYVCSDQKRVKPLNLDEVNRRQVPWNTTRPFSAGRRKRQVLQFARRNEVTIRPSKVTERVAVRTPKRLLVIKNRDPNVRRTIVLQRRTAPTFDALLDYLSQVLQFPVLKLFSTDGRRVDGLGALILCSGVVVAASNEPFRLGNYSFHRIGQMAQVMYMDTVEPSTLQPKAQNNKSLSSGRGSRNFSLSSERYIVNQIHKSRNESMNEAHHRPISIETRGTGMVDNERHACIVPQDDDIEKSFRVNQDGSMTVEMKVRLTIKEEEMLHWTTTLSRSSLSKTTVCASISESGNSSPDSNNAVAKESSGVSEDETKEENHPAGAGKGVGFDEERAYEGFTSAALGKSKTGFKRTPTPGPRHVKKKASVESVKMVTESGVQESTLGHYSYMEKTAGGETTEGYCIVKHSSSSSNRPVPKPRRTASAGASNKYPHSSIRSSGVAEVLQIQNNGMEVTETVMHIYESQGCYDNYFANEEYSADSVPLHGSTPAPESKPSTESGHRSSSNDCDIDFSWHPPTTGSLQRQKEEMLSLSSEPIANNLSPEYEAQTATNSQIQETVRKDKSPKSEKKKKTSKPTRNQKSSPSTGSSGKKQKESTVSHSKNTKHSSAEKLSSNASMGKKSLSSSESAKSGQKNRETDKSQVKKESKDEKTSRKEQALLVNTENVIKTPPKRQNTNKAAAKENGHNVNTPTGRPQMKKNISDILQPKKSLLPVKKVIKKPKSMTENRTLTPKKSSQMSESFSMPSLNPSPSEIHQYVEKWLEKVTPDSVPYTEEAITDETQPQTKVVFQVGADSESDEKTERQTDQDENDLLSGDAVKKSASCLSVPLHTNQPTAGLLHSEQYARGLCVSMPSVRVDSVQQESILRPHKSAEAISPTDSESPSSTSKILSPQTTLKPVLRQLCSSIQCIRGASSSNAASNLEKSCSLPDFPTQVASVFGSSCKAFLSFLSVMTLRDNQRGPESVDDIQSTSTSEAMLMLESLQKISAIEDEEEQRASLTDLQSRASSQLRERWRDFQILRERLESEPLSPRVSETEFALDVVSEGGELFEEQHLGLEELMEELNMPADLRAEISSTIHQAKCFYPVEESTFVETERNQSDSEEDVEKFVEEFDDETKQSPEPERTCTAENIRQTTLEDDDGEIDDLNIMQTVYSEQAEVMTEAEPEPDRVQEKEEEEQEDREEVNDREDGDTKVTDDDDDGEETEKGKREREEESEEEVVTDRNMSDEEQEEVEEAKGSEEEEEESIEKVAEGTEDEMTVDGEEEDEEFKEREKAVVEETEEGLMDEEDQEEREKVVVEETEEGLTDKEDQEEREKVVVEETEEGLTDEEDQEEREKVVVEETEEGLTDEEDQEEREKVVVEETEEGLTDEEDQEEREKVVVEETEEGLMDEEDQEEREKDSVEETDEREGDDQTEEEDEERGDEEQHREVIEEEVGEVIGETDDGEEVENVEEVEEEEEEEEEEEADAPNEEAEENIEVLEENSEEEAVEDGDEDEVRNIEERVTRFEEDEETEKTIKEEERSEEDEDEECRKKLEKTENSLEEEPVEEVEDVEEVDVEENMNTGLDEDEMEDEEELDEGLEQVENQESHDEEEEDRVTDEAECVSGDGDHRNLLEEASYLQQQSSCEEEANVDLKVAEQKSDTSTKYSSEGQCEDEKGNGTDTINEPDTDEGGEHIDPSVPHPVEISQELLDFVNSALQTSSLIFTYDAQGNVRIEPENARVVQTKQIVIPKSKEDVLYGLKHLPSPNTSDLSDYRPDSSESGGYKTQESVDVVTESGDEASGRPSPVCRHKTHIPDGRANVERAISNQSAVSNSEVLQTSQLRSEGSFSSYDSSAKASREDLSYFSAASSQKADGEPATEATQCISFASEKDLADGVLIDKGRWLLKENHLIRKSPPVSLGMYDNADSTSIDTGQENMSEDSPPHNQTQYNPLVAISSSELEEMAKPQTPKCTYYNMPHGSDSDPFLDDSSVKSGKKDTSSVKGRGVRVSPVVDTSKTWANKNGSLSSFASVEFKLPDGKVHPEGESSAVTQERRTSSGGRRALQSQDSLDALHVRCGQYCPIL